MKRIPALLLAVLLLLTLLVGCGDTTTTTPPADGQTDATDTPTTPGEPTAPAENDTADAETPANTTETPTNDQFDADADTELPKGFAEGSVFPICDDGEITLEYWRSANDQTLQAPGEPFADNYAWAEIEKNTGIHVKFNLFSGGAYATQLSMMFASQDYPDAANVIAYNYYGGWEQAVDDEIIVDLAQYKEDIPNYLRWVNLTVGNRKNAYTDTGMMPTFGMVYNHAQNAFYGYTIRQDWLDDLGLEMPDTIEEWDEVLKAFKENKTNGAPPMDLNSTGFSPMNFLEGAFNVSGETQAGLIVVDDVIHSSFRDQGFRDYLELMHGWYANGMIDPDFTSIPFMWNSTRLANGESGIVPAMYTQVATYCADAGMAPEGCYLAIMPQPTVSGYDRKVYHNGKYSSGLAPNSDIVFADSDFVEETIRWIDYRFSEEGYMITNYGIEGVTFHYDENGVPQLEDLLVKNPDGMSAGFAQEYYLIHNGAVVFLLPREENQASEEGRKYNELWAGYGEWNLTGNLTYTIEESEQRGPLVTDLTTYINEFVGKVIMGMTELNDATWAEFQNQLTTMGMDTVVEITQAAYDRYLKR